MRTIWHKLFKEKHNNKKEIKQHFELFRDNTL